jgi:hypothetical protein
MFSLRPYYRFATPSCGLSCRLQHDGEPLRAVPVTGWVMRQSGGVFVTYFGRLTLFGASGGGTLTGTVGMANP